MKLCACGSLQKYASCCGPYIETDLTPQSPEQLMRSRYTAYSKNDTDYIKKTMIGKPLRLFTEHKENERKNNIWIGLQVINSYQDGQDTGYVEFIATYLKGNTLQSIHEKSEFQRNKGKWFYIDGVHFVTPEKQKIAQNSLCPCGSLKKFKNCHG